MKGDFTADITNIFADIYERTGAEAYLTPRGGAETRFDFDFLGNKTQGFVKGEGEVAAAQAKLISYLLASADPHQIFPEKSEYLKSILLGEGSEWHAFRFLTKYNLPDLPCFAVDIVPEKNMQDCFRHLEGCLEDSADMVVRMDDTRLAVVKFTEEGHSPHEFGLFLAQTLYEEIGVRASVGVGCEMASFAEIALSYHQAATAVRMSGIFHGAGEVHSYREYLLVRLLENVPEARLKDYMQQFRISDAAEVFEDPDMTSTAEEFLESSLNISETARKLFMHRNTLMYRLDKIERVTGLNIRKFSDAVTFRVVTILYKLLHL